MTPTPRRLRKALRRGSNRTSTYGADMMSGRGRRIEPRRAAGQSQPSADWMQRKEPGRRWPLLPDAAVVSPTFLDVHPGRSLALGDRFFLLLGLTMSSRAASTQLGPIRRGIIHSAAHLRGLPLRRCVRRIRREYGAALDEHFEHDGVVAGRLTRPANMGRDDVPWPAAASAGRHTVANTPTGKKSPTHARRDCRSLPHRGQARRERSSG